MTLYWSKSKNLALNINGLRFKFSNIGTLGQLSVNDEEHEKVLDSHKGFGTLFTKGKAPIQSETVVAGFLGSDSKTEVKAGQIVNTELKKAEERFNKIMESKEQEHSDWQDLFKSLIVKFIELLLKSVSPKGKVRKDAMPEDVEELKKLNAQLNLGYKFDDYV